MWAELLKQYPQFVRETPAYWDANRGEWVREPAEWDSTDMPMPTSIWHRRLAREQGKSVAEIRELYRGRESERPQAISEHVEKVVSERTRLKASERELRAAGWIVGSEPMPKSQQQQAKSPAAEQIVYRF